MFSYIIIVKHFTLIICLIFAGFASSCAQSFVNQLGTNNLFLLYGKTCTVKLVSGEEIIGKFYSAKSSGSFLNDVGYFKEFIITLANGENVTYTPEMIVRLSIKASGMAKSNMLIQDMSSIQETIQTWNNYNSVMVDSIIFEPVATYNKTSIKLGIRQLLNPGFDSKIKVYDDWRQTGKFIFLGIPITGGTSSSYMFVLHDHKSFLVRKKFYQNSFRAYYGDCQQLVKVFKANIQWEDIAAHVYVHEKLCNH